MQGIRPLGRVNTKTTSNQFFRSTILAEQKQNFGNTGAERDVGRNLAQETSTTSGGLDKRLDEADVAKPSDFASTKVHEHSQVVGNEDRDAHQVAAAKQP